MVLSQFVPTEVVTRVQVRFSYAPLAIQGILWPWDSGPSSSSVTCRRSSTSSSRQARRQRGDNGRAEPGHRPPPGSARSRRDPYEAAAARRPGGRPGVPAARSSRPAAAPATARGPLSAGSVVIVGTIVYLITALLNSNGAREPLERPGRERPSGRPTTWPTQHRPGGRRAVPGRAEPVGPGGAGQVTSGRARRRAPTRPSGRCRPSPVPPPPPTAPAAATDPTATTVPAPGGPATATTAPDRRRSRHSCAARAHRRRPAHRLRGRRLPGGGVGAGARQQGRLGQRHRRRAHSSRIRGNAPACRGGRTRSPDTRRRRGGRGRGVGRATTQPGTPPSRAG